MGAVSLRCLLVRRRDDTSASEYSTTAVGATAVGERDLLELKSHLAGRDVAEVEKIVDQLDLGASARYSRVPEFRRSSRAKGNVVQTFSSPVDLLGDVIRQYVY